MDQGSPRLTREERLAAQLRENLKRRKAQARAQAASSLPEPAAALPKPRPPG
jgi:hypothetical protein